jgi:anti-anti-sigma factor
MPVSPDVPDAVPASPLTVDAFPCAAAAARVRVAGELDLATVPQLRAELAALLEAGRCELDLDLDGVTFCDVAGLTVLLRAHDLAVKAGGRLVVHGSCPPLRLMLRVLRPRQAFTMVPEVLPPGGAQA